MIGLEIWVLIAAICFIGELITAGFFILWFGVGASAAAVLNYLGFSETTQFIAFILVSIILLALSRPFAKRITQGMPNKKATSDRLIGEKGVVIEDISPKNGGVVRISGDTWRAISDQDIKEGNYVLVEKIEGIKLVVKPVA
ncbi:NfeD family protein [Methanobacterium sp.]|uniref:NfeD family protein n=1 Tax=Methanobacterium sp. TaxID=2164 RepID=UPI003C76DC12